MLTFPDNIKESAVTVYNNTEWFTRGPVSNEEWVYATTGKQGEDFWYTTVKHDLTVKHDYSKHTYNEWTLKAKLFSFPKGLKRIVKLTDIANYVYNKAEKPVPVTWL